MCCQVKFDQIDVLRSVEFDKRYRNNSTNNAPCESGTSEEDERL
jgi:hypothetical protein